MSAFGDFTVTRASTKNILGSNGLYQSVANNVPAFEFNANGSYRGLLVEPGATNLALHSQDFTNALWAKTVSASVTGNTGVAPDGTTTADTFTAGANGSQIQYSFLASAGVTYTASFFIRRITGTGVVNIRSVENVNTPVTITSSWQRYSVTATSTTTSIRIGMTLNTSGDEVEIWQAQLETGSVATSPIVTTGSTASRVADVVTLTGASSLIGQTEGTVFLEIDNRSDTRERRFISITDGSPTNRIIIWTQNNTLFCTANAGSSLTILNPLPAGIRRIAVNYAISGGNTVFRASVNGASVVTNTQVATPINLSEIDLGQREDNTIQSSVWHRSAALFPTALSDAQLQALTTL